MAALAQFGGVGQFGRAYQTMFENDAHVPGSVDCVLMERMIRLCPETAAYLYEKHTPTQVRYPGGSRPELERCVEVATAACNSDKERIAEIARFCADLGKNVSEDLDAMLVGGTEEEIIRRGSDWCTDVARVGCALYQVAGFPARLVYLADTAQAYSGHVIAEVYRSGAWGAADPTTAVVYCRPEGSPASTWELMNHLLWIDAHRKAAGTPYTRAGQFRCAAVSNYFCWEREKYEYTTSRLNNYYRSILEMSDRGWPGGLRWLHGEDTS